MTRRLFIVAIVVFSLMHLYGMWFPSAINWGFHQMAFLPPVYSYLAITLMLMLGFGSIQQNLIGQLERMPVMLARGKKYIWPVLLLLAAGIFWIGRERVFLYGDSYMVSELLRRSTFDVMARYYRNEPLAGFLEWNVLSILHAFDREAGSDLALQMISVICGITSIIILMKLAKLLAHDFVDRTLFLGFVIASGGTLLFFGHVENYPPYYAALLAYSTAGVGYILRRVSLIFPSLLFGVLVPFHFGALIFVPSLVMLFLIGYSRGEYRSITAGGLAVLVTITMLLWLCHYSLQNFLHVLTEGGAHLLSPYRVTGNWQAYTLFSPYHILEIMNLAVMLSFFAPLLLFTRLGPGNRKGLLRDPGALFFLIMAAGGLCFIFLMNTDLGMSIDWDLMSGFYLPLILCGAFIWMRSPLAPDVRRQVFIAVTCATAIHTALFAAMNLSTGLAASRYSVLPDQRLWGKNAILGSAERLALYYDQEGDLREALHFYNRYIDIDSTNERILSNIADLYQRLGDEKRMTAYLEKAVQRGTEEPRVYFVLAEAYRAQNRADEAYTMDIRGLALDSTYPEANLHVGLYLARDRKEYGEALRYFTRAAVMDTTSGAAYYYAGLCNGLLGNLQARDRYWERLLRVDSTSEYAVEVKRILGVTEEKR